MHAVRRAPRGAAALLVGLLFGRALAQPAAGPPPMIKQDAARKVAEHTFVILDDNVGMVPNVGIVVGERATLIVDTGLGRAQRRDRPRRSAQGRRQHRVLPDRNALSPRARPGRDGVPRRRGDGALARATSRSRNRRGADDRALLELLGRECRAPRGRATARARHAVRRRGQARPRRRARAREGRRPESHAWRHRDVRRRGPRAVHGRRRHGGISRARAGKPATSTNGSRT